MSFLPPSRSLPAALLLSPPVVFGGRVADGRRPRRPHHQGDAPGEPRVAERVAGLGRALGRLLHRGDVSQREDHLIQLHL